MAFNLGEKRITGFTTPFFGLSWENTNTEKTLLTKPITPNQKIKVFISSKCGDNGKYDKIRKELKEKIEATNLAVVYLFEQQEASSLTAEQHYTFALEDSDVCIFLIDNADGVPDGVQKEVDTVKRNGIKAIYYFCEERSVEKTALEKSLLGARFAKSKTVKRFDELSDHAANALINDIINIYHYYSKNRFQLLPEDNREITQSVDVSEANMLQLPTIPATVLKNIDKCKNYISELAVNQPWFYYPGETEKSSELDEWGKLFLEVLFEGKSIKQFNTEMFLNLIKHFQGEEYHLIVEKRWKAIQLYYLGNLEGCVDCLNDALGLAKKSAQPQWVVKDILIDIRNIDNGINEKNNLFYYSTPAQVELTDSNEVLYYPLIDRFQEDLYNKYIQELYKERIKSPYTVTFGNEFEFYGNLLASSYVVSLLNGSLTHLLLLTTEIRDFQFFFSCKYDNWYLKRDLLKYAIFLGKEKDTKALTELCPEILNNMSAEDATLIMNFCNNKPVLHERLKIQLLAFGTIGYYLKENDFCKFKDLIVNAIENWMNDEKRNIFLGERIFACLKGVYYRLPQNELAKLCILFIKLHFRRYYSELFHLIADCIYLSKMDQVIAHSFIDLIISILDDKESIEIIKRNPYFLVSLRKQDRSLTESLDSKIAECLPDFYSHSYQLETTLNIQQDYPKFIKGYVVSINNNNVTQGKDGKYVWQGIREFDIIRHLLIEPGFVCDESILYDVVNAVTNTLLKSKQDLEVKLDAISLLICIVQRYPSFFEKNRQMFESIIDNQDEIDVSEEFLFASNIDAIALKIGIQLLAISMNIDAYQKILLLMPYIQNDKATIHKVSDLILKYLNNDKNIIFTPKVEMIILQNVLQWLKSDYLNIRWNATIILLAMLRNPENIDLVNHKLLELVDTDCFYIKNLIMRQLNVEGIEEDTRNYIISKCEYDPNYVVRKACEEEKNKSFS